MMAINIILTAVGPSGVTYIMVRHHYCWLKTSTAFGLKCTFCSISDTFTKKKVTHNFQRRLMAQMNADTILMKNWTLICGKEYLCRKVLKKWMC